MLPSDWMRINTIASVQTLPMVAPVKGRWKCSFDYFYNPWSNIYGFMDNNSRLSTQQIVTMSRYIFPLGLNQTYSSLSSMLASSGKVPCGGVLDFLGCPVGYFGKIQYDSTNANYVVSETQHPAESFLTYIDVVRNYYVNNQLSDVPYVSNGYNEERSYIQYDSLPLADLDALFNAVRYMSLAGLSAPETLYTFTQLHKYLSNCRGLKTNQANLTRTIGRQTGLFLRNYRMDLLRGIMNYHVGEFEAQVKTVTDGSSHYVSMSDVYFANKLQTLINRIDITGGRFSDWIRTRWNVDAGIEIDRPIYLGSHSLWLNTVDVIATASGVTNVGSRNDNSVVGQQVGYQVGKMTVGSGKDRQRPITIKSKQYGTLMCIFSIVPDVVYSEGFELNMLKTKFADIYDPAFKQLGYQDVLRGEMSAFPEIYTNNPDSPINVFPVLGSDLMQVEGKRIAWSEYMASLNRSHGEFASGMTLDYWVNNRRYYSGDSKNADRVHLGDVTQVELLDKLTKKFDSTTYVYPHLWNTQFADTDLDAMNYMVDVYFQIDANRALGKRLMPHL